MNNNIIAKAKRAAVIGAQALLTLAVAWGLVMTLHSFCIIYGGR